MSTIKKYHRILDRKLNDLGGKYLFRCVDNNELLGLHYGLGVKVKIPNNWFKILLQQDISDLVFDGD